MHWNAPGYAGRPRAAAISIAGAVHSHGGSLHPVEQLLDDFGKRRNPRCPNPSVCELTYSDWTLLNEGPSGYAIAHVVGEVPGIVAGCAVGLRTGDGADWQICLVRWARSRSSSHVEMGLEVIAPSAKPVRIQTLAGRTTAPPIPALLLPALPNLSRGEAILTVRGDYNVRPFTLLQEHGDQLQVAECMPHRSLVETSSIEVFEFIRNPAAN
jgi:hypothetical protein